MNRLWIHALALIAGIALCAGANVAQQKNTATFDEDGTAHLTRVIRPPATISPEAQKWMDSLRRNVAHDSSLEERRKGTDEWRARQSAVAKKLFPVNIEEQTIGGVRCDVITPLETPAANKNRVLINLHGGGFNSDSGSLIEGDPIANLAKIKVVSVYYRLAPENPFPAAVDDVVAVYKELLKTYKPKNVGIFGTSAGAILTAEATAQFRKLGLPLPGALGIFSGLADYSRVGDSHLMYSLTGLPGEFDVVDPARPLLDAYVGKTDPKDPVLSPIFADLKGWPPSLLVTSTRDLLLSGTTIFHRALLAAGDDADLVVFEVLPHAFWYHFELPETTECLNLMAKYFDRKLGILTAQVAQAPGAKRPPQTETADGKSSDIPQKFDSRSLSAMGEASFFDLSKNEKIESYRFHWSRTFHHPICVRVDINPDRTGLLTTKITNGKGGYDPGRLITNSKRKLTEDEVKWFENAVGEADLWNLASFEEIGPNGEKQETITVDGADWTIEAVKQGNYHFVSRLSPTEGPVRAVGLLMLIDMARLKLLFQEVY